MFGGQILVADLEAIYSTEGYILFVWRLFLNRLPTRDSLKRKNINLDMDDNSCVFCSQVEESADHAFMNCRKIYPLWKKMLCLAKMLFCPT